MSNLTEGLLNVSISNIIYNETIYILMIYININEIHFIY